MGAVLLAGGTKGKRFALPSARILIHQGSGGFSGAIPDVEVAARETLLLSNKCISIIATHAGQSFDKVKQDAARDYYMSADEAKAYGIIDEVLSPANPLPGRSDAEKAAAKG